MIRFVNAKLNLGLNIVRKREDSYHELETLFYPVGIYNGTPVNQQPFCDILEIHLRPSGCEDEFLFSGNPIECALENNLVYRAVEAFRTASSTKVSFYTHLDKRIPDGAGLGGGSADASFALLMLNELCGSPLSKPRLSEVAASLGADCPFFIENTSMLATGIGEKLEPFPAILSGYWAVIVKPEVYISTKEAFAGITPEKPERSIGEIVRLLVSSWEKEGLKNDFEPHIFNLFPELDNIKNSLRELGADYAAMSGSGSSIFGIFRDYNLALQAYNHFDNSFICKL